MILLRSVDSLMTVDTGVMISMASYRRRES